MTDQRTSETTFAIATLGCKVNQADSEAISEQMSAAGFVQCVFFVERRSIQNEMSAPASGVPEIVLGRRAAERIAVAEQRRCGEVLVGKLRESFNDPHNVGTILNSFNDRLHGNRLRRRRERLYVKVAGRIIQQD